MPNLILGTTAVDTLYMGNTQIMKVYLGETLLFGGSTATLWEPHLHLPDVRAVMDIRQGRTPTTGAVSSWSTVSSPNYPSKSAVQATAANQPGYSANAFGTSIPGLTFDGNDFLSDLAVNATSLSRTVVCLASFTNASDHRTIVGGTGSHFVYRRNNQRRMSIVFTNTAAISEDAVVVPDNTPTLLSVRFTQNTPTDYRQNGRRTALANSNGNGLPQSSVMQIGRNPSGQSMLGSMGCIVIADSYVSDSDMNKIEGWLAHVNNVAYLLASDHPYKNSPPTV